MKKVSLIIIFASIFYFYQTSCQAMRIISAREISEFASDNLWGDVFSVRTMGQWNEYVRFTFFMPDSYSGKVRGSMLVSGSANNIDFTFLPGSIIKIFEFKAADPDMVFWIIKDNALQSNGLTHDFYMIGPYKNSYATYANMDNIVGMGWNSTNMKVHLLNSENAWPILQGYADNGSGSVLRENLVLSWDDAADWFSMTAYPLDALVTAPISGE